VTAAADNDRYAALVGRFVSTWSQLEPLIEQAKAADVLAASVRRPAEGFRTEEDALRRWLHLFRTEIDATRSARDSVVHAASPVDVRDLEAYVNAASRLLQVVTEGLDATPARHERNVAEVLQRLDVEIDRTEPGVDFVVRRGNRSVLVEAKALVNPSSSALSATTAKLQEIVSRVVAVSAALIVVPNAAYPPSHLGALDVSLVRVGELQQRLQETVGARPRDVADPA
jgi:hypothetical protein